jgi:TonB family protein
MFANKGGYSRSPKHLASAGVVALAALFASSVAIGNEPPVTVKTQPGLEEMLPPVARDEMLSTAQIRYCLAQTIRIEAIRPGLDRFKTEQVVYFNAVVADYNNRCGRYRYEAGALEPVKAQVEAGRAQIESDARDAFSQRFAPPSKAEVGSQAPPPARASQPSAPAPAASQPSPTTPAASQSSAQIPPAVSAPQPRAEAPAAPPASPAAKPPPPQREQAARAIPRVVPQPSPPARTEPPAAADTPLERFTKEIRRDGALVVDEPDYPAVAQGKGWEGSAYIDVRFAAQGYLRSINLAQSSGQDVLDERAVRIVRDLTFPDVPAELRGQEFTVRVPVVFRSRRPR